jgi:hypothetical protein
VQLAELLVSTSSLGPIDPVAMRCVRALGEYEVSIGFGRSRRSAVVTILLESQLAEGAARWVPAS